MRDLHSDLTSASDTIARVAAINAKHEAERQRMRNVLNHALATMWCVVVVWVSWTQLGAPEQHRINLNNQEASINVYRR
ncbi:hypothetical protein IB244_17195 [Rhizobium sp. RHZ02]|uniref:hypothetical protein n=1 Tax=Rhizobium sp. RHZ02 TaxID=2769306 RepID=UPI0017861292|nr:hypothetical protein [Rhizobium sp. RHZ02]MBD9453281.1 hypothetical protein [Rhizobium sp. RHZ02]